MHLRVLDDGPATPGCNMARDEALLLGGGPPTLRLYGWQPHAVSLGYFQAAAPVAALAAGLPIVRRPTGGGAICHGDELTFALILPAELLPRDLAQSYALVHGAVQQALAAVGVAATARACGPQPCARPVEPWCFAAPTLGDLLADGRKLVGSAQRRVRKPAPRVLHHGSLVLRRPALTPFVAAVADVADPARVLPALRPGIAAALGAQLGLAPEPGAWTAAETALAARLQAQRFDQPAFTFRR